MPTDNPKVSAYVPQLIYDRFKQFQDETQLSMSQATIVILAEYFGLEQTIKETTEGITVGGVTLERVIAIENRLADLEQVLKQKEPVVVSVISPEESGGLESSLQSSLKTDSSSELPSKLLNESPSNSRLTTAELATRLGMSRSTLNRWKSESELERRRKSPEELLKATREKDPDGIGWIFLREDNCFQSEKELPSSSSSIMQGELLSLESKASTESNK